MKTHFLLLGIGRVRLNAMMSLLNNVSVISNSQFLCWYVWVMVFNATFNNISTISWWSDLSVEETGIPGENHWQTLSHNIGSSTPCHERDSTVPSWDWGNLWLNVTIAASFRDLKQYFIDNNLSLWWALSLFL